MDFHHAGHGNYLRCQKHQAQGLDEGSDYCSHMGGLYHDNYVRKYKLKRFDTMSKYALVTGSSRGIGRAVALRLSKEGYNIILNCSKSVSDAEKVREEILVGGSDCVVIKADMGVKDEVLALADEAYRCAGNIDLLVNNAGISQWGFYPETTDSDIERILDVNVKGAMYLTREVSKRMTAAHRGCIINISSVWGLVGASCEAAYSATKAALLGFTKALAKELGPSGIRVNSVSPGVIMTDMMKDFSEEDIKSLKEQIPLGRLGCPDDVAEAVAFLASDRASYITGQDLSVNGGFVIN